MMSEKALEAKRAYKREYMKQWRKKNPQKVKETDQRYWERKAAVEVELVQKAE